MTTFISYAQNFEDVMLWRALRDVQNGFYIDVGAFSPDADSVTRAFYEKNWHGINIEPNRVLFQDFVNQRARDINLSIALGERRGSMTMSLFDNPGWSTLESTVVEKHLGSGYVEQARQKVSVETLNSIWRQYVSSDQDVHFLKIDTEGFEQAVLKGNNWSKNRPWIVVVEAVLPLSQEENYAAWEPLLLGSEYLFAYADGLNRFYVAKEHAELLDSFKYPPNVFDGFVLASLAMLESQRVEADSRANAADSHANEAACKEAEAQRKSAALEVAAQLAETRATTLMTELQKSQAELVVIGRELENANTGLTEKAAALLESEQRYSLLQGELDQASEEMHSTKKALSDSLAYSKGLCAENENLSAEIHRNKLELGEVNHSNQMLFDELETTKRDLYDMHWCNHNNVIAGKVYQNQLETVYKSTSWQISAPLRWLKNLILFLFRLPRLLLVTILRYLIAALQWPLAHAMRWVARRLWVRQRASAFLQRFPGLRSQLQGIAYRYAIVDPVSVAEVEPTIIEPQPNRATKIHLPLGKGERVFYIYVDHTVAYSSNTGVQRVTRSLAKALFELGECVRYVKWRAETQQCCLINFADREVLAKWNGPEVLAEDREIYPEQGQRPVSGVCAGENHWLIVPEVTHITSQESPVTLDLIAWAKRANLKTGFVFYDAIPLRCAELEADANLHATYMQHLLLADAVWPISDWSKTDLMAFWSSSECADLQTMPEVSTQILAGESFLSPRVKKQGRGKPVILSVGSIVRRKNQDKLIKAFLSYCKKNPETSWRLILAGHLCSFMVEQVAEACASGFVQHLGHVSDKDLAKLYHDCSFTVFPSVEEGFGLPILESIWAGKPCVCANFGAMKEVSDGGGCLQIDVRDTDMLEQAIDRLISDRELREGLTKEALARPVQSWRDYATRLAGFIEQQGLPVSSLGVIYFWIDATLEFGKNTGIQRVTRQLAKSLLGLGACLVPVKWGSMENCMVPVSAKELELFSKWNGPEAGNWSAWVEPDRCPGGWFFMPELPLNRSEKERNALLKLVSSSGFFCASIFYDAIPWKMRHIYPQAYSEAHRLYMLELNSYDLVLPICEFPKNDLVRFLGEALPRPQSLEGKIKAVTLAGEFSQGGRSSQNTLLPGEGVVRILCAGNIEPRKNHEVFLQAFLLACERLSGSSLSLQLTIAGGSNSTDSELAGRVRSVVDACANIAWEEKVDDARMEELYLKSHFTIYPSVEEGFGLPILESIWYAKPCICANFGSMEEVAKEGGCMMVDVRDQEALASAIVRVSTDRDLYHELVQQALSRELKTWEAYAKEIALHMFEVQRKNPQPSAQLPSVALQERAREIRIASRPRLSVCISTYNRADWLSMALRNWAEQHPVPIEGVEFLVCDNASSDHTYEVVKPYFNRPDFVYHRNIRNVGMLGNLRETAHRAGGEYIWILGDDDLLFPGSINRVLKAIDEHPKVSLVYLNYSYTREEDARNITSFADFFAASTPVAPSGPDLYGSIKDICARNENFFTAIYTLVFRRDHGIRAYSQNTASGRPFSSMITCIPTTRYVLDHMMDEPGVWIGEPQLVVNLNVSWMQYAPLWILERIPEVHEEVEMKGVAFEDADRWRLHALPGVIHYFGEIFKDEHLDNSVYFSPERLVRRFKHLPEFLEQGNILKEIYLKAQNAGHPAAQVPFEQVFFAFEDVSENC